MENEYTPSHIYQRDWSLLPIPVQMEDKSGNDTFSDLMWNLIKTNDFEAIDSLLSALNDKERALLLNGIYRNEKDNVDDDNNGGENEIFKTKCDILNKILHRLVNFLRRDKNDLRDESRPLFTCIVFGSFDVLKIFVKHDVSLHQVAEHGWNIIHYLVLVSHYDTNYESKAVEIYKRLQRELDRKVLRDLLMMEDKFGLRPLELAMHASCIQLFHTIINTYGVYLVKRERKGLIETSWYDIDEYENPHLCDSQRFDKSPVKLLSCIDRQALKSARSVKLLRKGMIREWASAKVKSNIIFVTKMVYAEDDTCGFFL